MSDPCACMFDREAAMRRIIAILRDGDTECDDSSCSTFGGISGNLDTFMSLFYGFLLFVVFFIVLRNARQRRPVENLDGKPGSSGDSNDRDGHDDFPGPGVH